MKPVEEQLALIRRGVAGIEPLAELRKKLEKGTPLRVKYGIDPTGIDVHLGHTVPLRKMRLFQELGHKAVLIIGNATALVGDPSGRDEVRKGLTPDQIEANARQYLVQIGRIIDVSQAEVRYNGEWFSRFGFGEVLRLTGQITMQRMLERDDFTKRMKAETPIYLHECLYPLMQAHDSVEIRADVELGGTEQLFNLMLGRDLQRNAGQEPQICLTMPILRGTDGVKKMGKSLGNYIGVGESAYDQFAKAMSVPDALMAEWFTLLTDRPAEEVGTLSDPAKTHPKAAKKLLAAEIVTFYHGAEAAKAADDRWEKEVAGGQGPSDIPDVEIARTELQEGHLGIVKLLTLTGLAKSGNEARRVLGPNSGVTLGPDRQKITDDKARVPVVDGLVVRVGSRRAVRVRLR